MKQPSDGGRIYSAAGGSEPPSTDSLKLTLLAGELGVGKESVETGAVARGDWCGRPRDCLLKRDGPPVLFMVVPATLGPVA